MTIRDLSDSDRKRRDLAARAAWLYFIAGRTQDEIASQLDLSRQAAQRLVAYAVGEKLVRFRLDHPISSCMELASRLVDRYGLEFCEVTPSDPSEAGSRQGVAIATAARLERILSTKDPIVLCVGTGRTMRAAVDELDTFERPQHRIVSLVGNVAAAGHGSPYDVVMRLADKLGAHRYPMPAPVLTDTVEDRKALQSQRAFNTLLDLRTQAKASFFGIGEIGPDSTIQRDGFMSDEDMAELIAFGAVGEITGWAFDRDGRILPPPANTRVASLPLETPPGRLTVVAGCGPRKVLPLRAALTGRLVSAVVTDETTARAVLND